MTAGPAPTIPDLEQLTPREAYLLGLGVSQGLEMSDPKPPRPVRLPGEPLSPGVIVGLPSFVTSEQIHPGPDGWDADALIDFWSKIIQKDGHWLWTGALDISGAGFFEPPGAGRHQAHRVTWMMLRGRELSGYLKSTCGVKTCVLPEHRRSPKDDGPLPKKPRRRVRQPQTDNATGRCPVCNHRQALKKDGTLRAHGGGAGWEKRCEGSNRAPVQSPVREPARSEPRAPATPRAASLPPHLR